MDFSSWISPRSTLNGFLFDTEGNLFNPRRTFEPADAAELHSRQLQLIISRFMDEGRSPVIDERAMNKRWRKRRHGVFPRLWYFPDSERRRQTRRRPSIVRSDSLSLVSVHCSWSGDDSAVTINRAKVDRDSRGTGASYALYISHGSQLDLIRKFRESGERGKRAPTTRT